MLKSWVRAFGNSMAGLRHAALNERPVRHEAVGLGLGLVAAPFVAETPRHAVMLVAVIVLVVAIELLNNAIEAICDLVHPERHELVKIAKDSGSAAVLLVILVALSFWIEALASWVVSS